MTIGIGVVGVGDVAQRDYLPEFRRLGTAARLVSVSSLSGERARTAAEAYAIPSWTTDYREVLSNPDVDAVLNLTPIPVHEEVTRAALVAGKHVYSEKPIAASAAAARALSAEAVERGLVLITAPSILLFPQVERAARLLHDGLVGRVTSAYAYVSGGIPPWAGYQSDPTPFFAKGAGPLVDMAVYPLHALTGLLGDVTRVGAMSSRSRDSFVVDDGPYAGLSVPIEVDDTWVLLLEFASGAIACVEANFSAAATLGPELQIRGDAGVIGLSLLDVSAPIVRADGEKTVDEQTPHEREGGGPDHLLGVAHLLDCITSKAASRLSASRAAHVLDVIAAAQASAQARRQVDVPPSA